MLYKLPKSEKALSKEIKDKVNKLVAPKDSEWKNKFDDVNVNKNLYEELINKINSGSIKSDELNVTISNKKKLEEAIIQSEIELLKMLNEPFDVSDIEKSTIIMSTLSGNGFISIRKPKGSYTKPRTRK